ncbi:L,D-transpeptidase [Limimaricola cinnabarinus]|uniref:L,D-transpeptidase n=1 Tax=Limimaricola cinnabarinus TaxID=1125964 RepID=UPI002493B430|nr:L,D-transpeptidase [Limimaricola cinnabarinus]
MKRRNFLQSSLGFVAAGAAMPGMASEAQAVMPPREVDIMPGIPAGQIHVMPDEFALYWTLPGDRALRYGIGVGRDDLYEAGDFVIDAKKEWPSWTPTPGMIERQPELYSKWADGMPGGPDNPLGARALYLFKNGWDTFLRIHGTNHPNTIGTSVSNGCARLVNDQMIALYDQVPMGTKVFLYPKAGMAYDPAEAEARYRRG